MTDKPNLTSMTPAKAWRAWRRYFADIGGPDYIFLSGRHMPVELALGEYQLNYGKQGEEMARMNLTAKLAEFNPNYT